jgi:glycosyltransferase involved in cell wall biosynthesis
MVILEAFAAGTPVIGAATGGIPELVTHGETGLLFPVGDAQALRDAIDWAFTHPEEMRRMGRAARQAFESKYGPDQGYANLMTAYETAIRLARAG